MNQQANQMIAQLEHRDFALAMAYKDSLKLIIDNKYPLIRDKVFEMRNFSNCKVLFVRKVGRKAVIYYKNNKTI